MENTSNITSKPITNLLKQIAIPASTGSLFQTLFNIVDTFFAGQISSNALAALAKSFPLYFIIISAGIGIIAGCNSLISNSLGHRNRFAALIYTHHTFVYALLVSLIITVLGVIFSYEILKLMGSSSDSITLAKKYTDIIFYGTIFFLLLTSLNAVLYAQGDTKTYRNVLLLGLFANILLNPIFIFGFLFIPAFGIAGLAISTILIQFCACLYLFYKVNKTVLKISLKLENFLIKKNFFINIFNQCMPITFALFLVAIGSYILLSFISFFGDNAIAGYGAAIRFEHIFTLPVIGLNTAVITIAGQNFGARRYDRVREVYSKAIWIGFFIMCISGIIVFFLSEHIVGLFTNDLEVIKFGSNYLKIAAFIGPIYPVFFISHALFTVLKKTHFIFYSNLFRMVILPFVIVWSILNVFDGYFQDIFFGLLLMNWFLGFLVLFISRALMIKTFKEQKKIFFIF